jgi:diguanylate cyclase (GGDEF)-like protein
MTPLPEPPTNGHSGDGDAPRTGLDSEQTIADAEQSASDIDQTTADADQSAADRDQESSGSDQAFSDADQRASDRDQAIADLDGDGTGVSSAALERERELSRTKRAETSTARAQTATIRAQTEIDRFAAADQRDEAARSRDIASAARDLAAIARDRLATQYEQGLSTSARKRVAEDRKRAAEDRRQAAIDREQARVDREELRVALSASHFDDLTGTYRRAMGKAALQAEIDRAHRSGGRLVLAFVDVDALKEHNDRDGHAAGDALLLVVVASIRSKLRSYDPVVRFGGDEFVCALTDADLGGARSRFTEIQGALEQAHPSSSISVGFAELQSGDTLDELIARGDGALYAAKQGK